MATFDYPRINEMNNPEDNIRQIKAYLMELTDQMNYEFSILEKKIKEMERQGEE